MDPYLLQAWHAHIQALLLLKASWTAWPRIIPSLASPQPPPAKPSSSRDTLTSCWLTPSGPPAGAWPLTQLPSCLFLCPPSHPAPKQGCLLWEQSSPKSLFIFFGVNLTLRKGSGMTALGTEAHLETWIMWNISLHGSPTRPITLSSFLRISANFLWGHQKVIS